MIKSGRMPIAVFPLFNSPHVSAYADEDTTLRIVLHYMRIGTFVLEVGFTVRGEGQSLRQKFPA